MKNEIRYRWVFILLVIALVLSPVAVQIRLSCALPQIALEDISRTEDTSSNGIILTSNGDVAYDGTNTLYYPFYAFIANVVPSGNAIKHLRESTLAYKYQDELSAAAFTVIRGTHPIEGKSGKVMTTTVLSGKDHERLAKEFGDIRGTLYAYNYITGEVLIMISLPTGQTGDKDSGYLTNRACSTFTSGSTIKVITIAAALTQNPELENFTYTCTGTYKLASGQKITCSRAHGGPMTIKDALGTSCNCFMAELLQNMDENVTAELLEQMGFNTYENVSKTGSVDALAYKCGYITFMNKNSFDDLWKLIGQGNLVSPIDMAQIAGAIVNDGKAAAPHIVESIYNPNKDKYTYKAKEAKLETLVDPEAANTLDEIWSDAVEEYYHNRKNPLDSRITHAKTGTSEHTDNSGKEYYNRLLLGVMEDYNVSFMLVLEHTEDNNGFGIANALAEVIANTAQ